MQIYEFEKNSYPESVFGIWEQEHGPRVAVSPFSPSHGHISIGPFLILVAKSMAILVGLFPKKAKRKQHNPQL